MNCSQCGKPAIVRYGDQDLCVEHHLKMQQATYLQVTMLAAQLNLTHSELEADAGIPGLFPRFQMPPPPPFIGDNVTLHNIDITDSTIGEINIKTVQNLGASIELMQHRGESELAATLKELIEAIIKNNEINQATKNEIADQLEFLVAQATTESGNRSVGMVKSIMAGLKDLISTSAGLLTIWDRLEPLIRATLNN